jgi:hypothetical protein
MNIILKKLLRLLGKFYLFLIAPICALFLGHWVIAIFAISVIFWPPWGIMICFMIAENWNEKI